MRACKMAYVSKWVSLCQAAEQIETLAHASAQQGRADLCKAMSDGNVEIRAKLARHATRPQTSREAVEGRQLQIPTGLRPEDIDWPHSRPNKPWALRGSIPRHHVGPWLLDWIQVDRESVERCFMTSVAKAAADDSHLAAPSPRKRRVLVKRRAAELIIQQMYPEGVPSPHKLLNDKLVDRVSKALKESDNLVVSRDTILRAAKRRGK